MTMQLDHDELHRLLAALAESDIQEFRLEGDDFRLEVRRNLPAPSLVSPVMPVSSVEAISASTVSDSRVDVWAIGSITIIIASIVCLLAVRRAMPIVSISSDVKIGLKDIFLYTIPAYANSGVAKANNIPI